ncbi:MAG TPA: hypothetical protein PLB12_02935 [Candidatus Goldiibacteriota bacterium]|nr:hypothetical protein [Candidatus Goldiibacteriota bacterium]HPI03125.1 hypothetical protein [Candidatus Goldiibacteriota bacterium]HPN64789.1 hypothetical protein [Candidatus Goldiibacteriota bacterium]HRQ43289.1 hypothetical protein [Candidatus Goldiibacteriota bacterium]
MKVKLARINIQKKPSEISLKELLELENIDEPFLGTLCDLGKDAFSTDVIQLSSRSAKTIYISEN